jgi:tryptophanyl-tRNA synthetase
MRLTADAQMAEEYEAAYNSCVIRYGNMKKDLAEALVSFVRPIRERAAELQKDEAALRRILKDGAEKARESAAKTISEARKMIGINYY